MSLNEGQPSGFAVATALEEVAEVPRQRRSRAKPVVAFPQSLCEQWEDPNPFHLALVLHMTRHGDSPRHLHKAVTKPTETFDLGTLLS